MTVLPRGPVMLDVAGVELTGADRERIAHPLVGGVILFARNYASPAQLKALTAAIRALREPAPLIGVDRFRRSGATASEPDDHERDPLPPRAL